MPAVSSHSSIIDVTVHCINAPAAAPFNPTCLYAWSCFTMTLMTSTSAYNLEAVNCVRASQRDLSRLSLMNSAVSLPEYLLLCVKVRVRDSHTYHSKGVPSAL